jgi:hypothetical protein
MTVWTSDELAAIANAAELQIAPLRPDGTPRNPVTIWVQIDAAYRSKYRTYGGTYVEPMVSSAARATTIRLVPA